MNARPIRAKSWPRGPRNACSQGCSANKRGAETYPKN